jgi:signal transduction histidine kinase
MTPESAREAAQPSLSAITHDLRTPLNAIKAWAHVLDVQLSAHDDPIVRRALEGIMTGIEQQVRLIDRLAGGK